MFEEITDQITICVVCILVLSAFEVLSDSQNTQVCTTTESVLSSDL